MSGSDDADLAEVRRLLRSARAEGPPPPEVIARLDDTLTSLVAEREAEGSEHEASGAASTSADELAARRRRRWLRVTLVAAAAVLVAGFLGRLVIDDATTPAGEDSRAVPAELNRDSAEAAPEAEAQAQDRADEKRLLNQLDGLVARWALDVDERRAFDLALAELDADGKLMDYQSQRKGRRNATSAVRCAVVAPAADSAATLVRARIDRSPWLLAIDPPRADGTRTVRAFDCLSDDREPARVVEVPAAD